MFVPLRELSVAEEGFAVGAVRLHQNRIRREAREWLAVEQLLASLTALGLEPHEVLFCGDTVIDGEAARRAGTHFCAVLNGTTTFEEFQTRRIPCDHVAGDLWDLKQWLGLN